MRSACSTTIVFIHGLFLNPQSWGSWPTFFRSLGYLCHTPAYPFHEGIPEDLRMSPPREMGELTFTNVVDHLSDFIDQLPVQPILVGHSTGALVVQKLLEQGRGTAGVLINSAPPSGIRPPNSPLLKDFWITNPWKEGDPCLPTSTWFARTMCPSLTVPEAEVEFQNVVVPESRLLVRTSSGDQARIDFQRRHPPLLFVSGDKDPIFPTSLSQQNFERYTDSYSQKTIAVFPGRDHHLCNQPGWEEIAGFVDDWFHTQR